MKKYHFLSVFAICFLFSNFVFAANIWENMNFPTLKISITSVTSDGKSIYVGTNRNGLFYTIDNGRNWTSVPDNLSNINLKFLIQKGKNLLIAISENEIYITNDDGKKWTKYDYFFVLRETINCYAVGRSGDIYIGTDKGLYISKDNAESWEKITRSLDDIDILSLTLNEDEDIFFSISSGDRGEIYKSMDMGKNWSRNHDGISGSYKAKKLATKKDIIYAWINNDIYFSLDKAERWSLLEKYVKDKFVSNIDVTISGDLMVIQDEFVSIWDIREEKWIFDEKETNLPEIINIAEIEDDGYAFAYVGNKLYRTIDRIDDIIREFHPIYEVRVIDHYSYPIVNTTFNLMKNGYGVGTVTTNADGYFSTSGKNFINGDKLRISKFVKNQTTVKPGHNGMGNVMYAVFLDNIQFDSHGAASDLVLSNDFYPTAKLNHTELLFNLIVSVQWDAQMEYLDSLESFLRTMSNYLYDVTDGQLRLHQVDIYDNRVKWDESDIQIFASNSVWPNANVGSIYTVGGQVHMPRKWFGGSDFTRNGTAKNNWLQLQNGDHYRTITHELGHYLFDFWDEYVYMDGTDPDLLPAYYNYGFMDYQYPNGNDWASEMSSTLRYPSNIYEITAQWGLNGSDCWTQFENNYEGTFDGFKVPIITPLERSILSDFMPGPNENLDSPEFDVGKLMVINKYNFDNGAGRSTITVTENSNPIGQVNMMLMKPINNNYRKVDQGKTADNGKIIIIGANVGDLVRVNYYEVQYGAVWSDTEEITAVSSFVNDNVIQDMELKLKKIDGVFKLNNELKYSPEGVPQLIARPETKFIKEPIIEAETREMLTEVEFPYKEELKGYLFELPSNIGNQGQFEIRAFDNSGDPFYIPFKYCIVPFNRSVNSGDGELLFAPSPDLNELISEFTIMSTPFFTSRNGLDKDSERGSNNFLLSSFPNEINEKSKNLMSIRYEQSYLKNKAPDLLKLFRWDNSEDIWELVGGVVDTSRSTVYAHINRGGCYALFTKENSSGIFDNYKTGELKLKITPNPASSLATLAYELPETSTVMITIFNSSGEKLDDLMSSALVNEGEYQFGFSIEALSSGTYFVKVETSNINDMVKLVVIK